MDEENKKFDLTSFFIKGIIVIIFILFVIWLLSITTFSDRDGNKDSDNKKMEVTNNIFKDNLNKIKDAGIKYFTDDKLPKDRDSNVILSLDDMINKKIIDDKTMDKCSKDDSYIMVYVSGDKYKLEVNLECDKDSDKLVIDLGEYNAKVMYEYVKKENGYWSLYTEWSDWTTKYISSSDSREVDVKSEIVDYSYYLDWVDLIVNDKIECDNVCYNEVNTKVLVTGKKTVYYYRYRDRYYQEGNAIYKWSYNNDDKKLKEQGYMYTGEKKET